MQRTVLLFSVVIVLLVASVPPANAQTGIDVSKLVVTDADDVGPFKPNTSLYLSPDGARMAQVDPQQICILSAAGQPQTCYKSPLTLDQNSVRWSPDSTRLTFTEDFYRVYRDPDIWVLDAATGKAEDLTDDGIAKVNIMDQSKNGNLDLLPTWTPDSQSLFFIRFIEQDKIVHAVLHSIHADGSGLTQLEPLNGLGFFSESLAVSPDGKRLAYNYGNSCGATGDRDTIWLADTTGKNNQQLWQCKAAEGDQKTWQNTIAENLTFSPDGQYLLSVHPEIVGMAKNTWDATSNHVSPIDGSDPVVVDADHTAQAAAWAPSGSALVYLVRNAADQNGLYVVDKPGGNGRLLYPGNFWAASASTSWRGLSWASNDTILVVQDNKTYKLLHLGTQ